MSDVWLRFSGPPIPASFTCSSCGVLVLTGRDLAILWGERGWCIDCWFDSNTLAARVQTPPLLLPKTNEPGLAAGLAAYTRPRPIESLVLTKG